LDILQTSAAQQVIDWDRATLSQRRWGEDGPHKTRRVQLLVSTETKSASQMPTHEERVKLQAEKHVNSRMERTGDTDLQIRR